MPNPKGKKSFRAWLYPETIDMINNNYKKIHCRSRSQFIDRAVDFYTGYINADDDSYYIPKAILSNLHGIVDMAESRINRMEFRNCVELAMIESILAVTNDINRDDIEKLRGDCVQIVKRTNGNFNFEDVFDWHRGKGKAVDV